jgi:hypothetical protein
MKKHLLKFTGILGFSACCIATIILISTACYLLKSETGRISLGDFLIVGSNFLLFILAAISTVVFYQKILRNPA